MIKFFLDPFNILLIFVLGSAILYFTGKKTVGRNIAIIALLWFLVISTPLIPNSLLGSLEERYVPIYPELMSDDERALPYYIVVLGGGHGYDDRLPPNSLLSLQALARLNEGIRLHHQLPNSKLVLSGYSASGRIPQAIMLRDTAFLLGIEEENMFTLEKPGNTFEEGKEYSNEFGGEPPVILVTSARHMPRAVRVFHYHGISVTASPAEYGIKQSSSTKWIGMPSVSNIKRLSAAIHEYAGIGREVLRR